eukprot:sb/3476776/
MSTPRSIKLNKDIFLRVIGDICEVLSDQNLNGLGIPVIRNLLRVKMFLKVSREVVAGKLGKVLLGQVGEVRGVLIDSLSQLRRKEEEFSLVRSNRFRQAGYMLRSNQSPYSGPC